MTLRLRVPALSDVAHDSVETRRTFVEAWIESLPYADPARLMEALYTALAELNRSPIKYRARLEVLECYIAPYQYLFDLIRGHGAVHTIAAFEKHRGETDATRQIANELAYGYKLVLSETVGRSMRAKKETAAALQRAVTFLSHVLLHSYHEYLPTPEHVWAELAELYTYGADRGIAAAAVPRRTAESELTGSIEDTYKAILVTSLIDPYQLVYGDIWKVHTFITERIRGVQLRPAAAAPTEKIAGVFHVAPDRDQRPVPYAMLNDLPRDGLELNTRALLTGLQRRLDELQQSGEEKRFGAPGELEARFTSRILVTLGRPPVRAGERAAVLNEVTLTTGLATVHYFVRTGTDPEAVVEDPSAIDVSDILPGENTNFSRHTYATEQWTQVDRRGGGMGIVRPARPSHAISVGDLVGLSEGNASEWSSGILRWLNVAGDGAYQAGVEFLSQGAEPIELKHTQDNSESRIGLRLSASRTSRMTIVVPMGTYQPNCRLFVRERERSYQLRLVSVVEALVACEVVEADLLT